MLNYVENGLAIELSLMSLQDRKTANETALSELQKLKDAKELKLVKTELAILLERESELRGFSEISRTLMKFKSNIPDSFPLNLFSLL
jgi:hypothetical protein